MAAAVAPSQSHSHRSAGRSAVASPPLCGSRAHVDPAPTCVAASREQDAADKDATRRRHYRGPHDDEPRRMMSSPSTMTSRRRRRDDDREASPDRKRGRGSDESASRAGHNYSRDGNDDDARRRGRDVAHRAARRRAGGRKRSGRRAREGTTRRGSSRSEERNKAYPSGADPAGLRKPSPVEEVVERAEVDAADEGAKRMREREELQRKREEFRRELDKVVRTVWFNDPYISPLCMLNRMPRWTLRTNSEVEEGEVV